jgi:microsomal dipeptidase-like Zn-dependent dipeptidase
VGFAEAASPDDCGDTRLEEKGRDVILDALFGDGRLRPGIRRLVPVQRGNLVSKTSRTFVQHWPMDVDEARIGVERTGGKGQAYVWVCSTSQKGTVRLLGHLEMGRDEAKQTLEVRGVKGERLSVRLAGRSLTRSFRYELRLQRPGAGERWVSDRSLSGEAAQPVVGIADLHNHHSAPMGFGGGVISGSIWDTQRFPDAPVAHAGPKKGVAKKVVYEYPAEGIATGETRRVYRAGHHECHQEPGRPTRCWADFVNNKMNVAALDLARQGGLKLMVTHVVNNQALCWAAASLKRPELPCQDMDSAKYQLSELKRFAQAHPWYAIVRDPWEARRAIAQGKLAVVLGVEVSNVLPDSDGDWEAQLDELHHMGVRLIYIAHESNSEYAGAAFHHWPMLAVNQVLKTLFTPGKSAEGRVLDLVSPVLRDLVEGKEPQFRNPRGLTERGKKLVQAMMDRKMLIDIDHLSAQSTKDLEELVEKNRYYPLLAGHTRVDTLLARSSAKDIMELVSTEQSRRLVAESGGIFALRPGPDAMKAYGGAKAKNDCHGSVKSFAQYYEWFVNHGYSVAVGSDANGYVPLLGPRWGEDACPAEQDSARRAKQKEAQGSPPRTGKEPAGWDVYVDRGMVDLGALPAVVHDLGLVGADTAPLMRSAEAFLKSWERAWDERRAKVTVSR